MTNKYNQIAHKKAEFYANALGGGQTTVRAYMAGYEFGKRQQKKITHEFLHPVKKRNQKLGTMPWVARVLALLSDGNSHSSKEIAEAMGFDAGGLPSDCVNRCRVAGIGLVTEFRYRLSVIRGTPDEEEHARQADCQQGK